MELNSEYLTLVLGGGNGGGAGSPTLPEKKKSQSVETDSFSSSLTAEPVKLSELPKP